MTAINAVVTLDTAGGPYGVRWAVAPSTVGQLLTAQRSTGMFLVGYWRTRSDHREITAALARTIGLFGPSHFSLSWGEVGVFAFMPLDEQACASFVSVRPDTIGNAQYSSLLDIRWILSIHMTFVRQ